MFKLGILRSLAAVDSTQDLGGINPPLHANLLFAAFDAKAASGKRAAHGEKLVEAGGVEPPSEKRYGPKPTCLSQFGVRPGPCGLIARSPAALGMSKMRNQLVRWISPEPYGPKGLGQLTV